jgi:hypothetical protein
MAQGSYAAYTANAAGAEFRAQCGPSPDGDRSDIQSVSYVRKGGVTERNEVQGTITIDGSPQRYTFAAKPEPDGPIGITLGADDLDSLESLKSLVGLIRQGRSMTVEVPTFRARDTFTLSGAAQALGDCK